MLVVGKLVFCSYLNFKKIFFTLSDVMRKLVTKIRIMALINADMTRVIIENNYDQNTSDPLIKTETAFSDSSVMCSIMFTCYKLVHQCIHFIITLFL